MKRIVLVLFSICIILTSTYSLGYSNEYISFDIPNEYTFSSNVVEEYYKSWKMKSNKDDGNIIIGIASHNGEKGGLEFTEDYLNSSANKIKKEFQGIFNSTITVLNSSITTVGSKYYRCFFI